MQTVNSPLFCLTCDLEWASDYALQSVLELVGEFGIKPTVFATHDSAVLRAAAERGQIELGIQPDFQPGSAHGSDVVTVLDHLCGVFPTARSFRSRYYRDDSQLTGEMVRRGFRYDSNLCLSLQADLLPLRHQSGLTRFPVFWEDTVHCSTAAGWNVDKYLSDLTSPGLKVLNVHPFMVAANVSSDAYYQSIKHHLSTLDAAGVDDIRFNGEGVQTFLRKLLGYLTARGERFYTLSELYRMFALSFEPVASTDKTAGRQTTHSEDDVTDYPSWTDAAKQRFVQREFDGRNATDPYATSRDYNMRELEIAAIERQLSVKGEVLDLGSGNGYSLISIASRLEGWRFTGVDFSQNLIDGAQALAQERATDLKSTVEFVYADAIEYLKQRDDGSVKYIVTERFLQNLPNRECQKSTIRDAYRVLAPGGYLLMCEGSEDSFEGLNELRAAVGLDRIPTTTRENVTAIRFNDADIENFIASLGFVLKEKLGFATYFAIARVLHPLLVAPQAPRFDARINDLARLVQMNVPFDPGCGGNVLWVCEKPQGGTER